MLLIVLGIVLLWVGGEILVRSVTGLAALLRVSPTVIGLTVVAFGTSAPELVTAVSAALRASPGLIYGNVVGSNIANVGLILGLSALQVPLDRAGAGGREQVSRLVRRELPFMLATSALVLICAATGHFGPTAGVVLLVLMAFFLIVQVRSSDVGDPAEPAPAGCFRSVASVLGTVLGLAFLIYGADKLLVPAAQDLARAVGVTERVIGLTVVAFGTSVPELAACLVAAYRRHHDIVLGNIIGSNVFNLLLVLPTGTLLSPFATTFRSEGIDAIVMLVFSGLMFIAVDAMRQGRRIGRIWGAVLLLAYLPYVALLFTGR